MSDELRDVFARRWVCGVVRSGFHNGAHCHPSEPHDEWWRCGYRWEASITDAQWEALNAVAASGPTCTPGGTE